MGFGPGGDVPRRLPEREPDREAELCSGGTGKGGDVLCALLLLLLPDCGDTDDPDALALGTGDGECDWL